MPIGTPPLEPQIESLFKGCIDHSLTMEQKGKSPILISGTISGIPNGKNQNSNKAQRINIAHNSINLGFEFWYFYRTNENLQISLKEGIFDLKRIIR